MDPAAPQANRAASNDGGIPAARTASSLPEGLALAVGCEAAVLRALERAGGQLLTRADRGRYPNIPKAELHTRLKVNGETHARQLLAGAWEHLPATLSMLDTQVNVAQVQQVLATYCTILLTGSIPHEPRNLITMLRTAGLVPDGQ